MKLLFKTIPSLAKVFSKDRQVKFFFLVFALWYFVVSRKFFKFKEDFSLNLVFNKKPLRYSLRHPMDLAVLHEIYVEKEYEWYGKEEPKNIVDLGAHFGDTTLYYHARFPNAKIIAVEPSPENYERLVKHVQHIPNIIAVNAAVGSKNGTVELNLVNSTLGHSIVPRGNTLSTLDVPAISLASLMEKFELNEIDLLKFDIEGAEFQIFETLSEEMVATSMIGELHFDLVEGWNLESVKNKLRQYSVSFATLDHHDRYVMMATRNINK